MLVNVEWAADAAAVGRQVDLPADESGFWKGVASFLQELPVPTELSISCELGKALLDVSCRGSWYENGVAHPSMYVKEIENTIEGLSPSTYPKCYLVCVNPESKGGEGSYKRYEMEQVSEREIRASYGPCEGHRGSSGSVTYPSRLYWIRHAEKLTKGYRDRSREYLGDKVGRTGEEVRPKPAVDTSTASGRLYGLLLDLAEKCCRANLRCGVDVTVEMAREARRCLNNMAMSKDLAKFNKWTRALIEVSPRSAHTVSSFFAKSEADFAKVISREEGLVAAMEAVASSKRAAKADAGAPRSFADLDIEVAEVSLADAPLVRENLKGTPLAKVRRVYEVRPKAQHGRHMAYRRARGIAEESVRYLWHGSRNENWLSIMENSLMLNPVSAVRTGAMFGPGIYFAPSCEKSWNYTSFRGSYWASGRSNTAFMGLYECAYGNPYVVQSAGCYSLSDLDARGRDCVHAYAGCSGLRNEEIVFYDEAAMCIRYLVEFGD